MGVKTVALSLLAAALPPYTAARGASVTWNLAAPLPHPVSPGLFSFTADFHAPESSCHGSGPARGSTVVGGCVERSRCASSGSHSKSSSASARMDLETEASAPSSAAPRYRSSC